MLNLEKFGVSEMSVQEQKETEGGLFFLLVGLVLLAAAAYTVFVIAER
jgi:hypothetical protein